MICSSNINDAAAACTLLGLSEANAQVTLTLRQSGTSVIASWGGYFRLRGTVTTADWESPLDDSIALATSGMRTINNQAGYLNDDYQNWVEVVSSPNTTFFQLRPANAYSGMTFEFDGTRLSAPTSLRGQRIFVSWTYTINDYRLNEMGITSYEGNNRKVFQGTGSNYVGSEFEIWLKVIPECNSALLGMIGMMLLVNRRESVK